MYVELEALTPNSCQHADNSIIREEHFCVNALRFAIDLLEGDMLTQQHPTLILHHVPACQILVLCNFSTSWILK